MANSARFEGRTPNRASARRAWRDGYFESVWWLNVSRGSYYGGSVVSCHWLFFCCHIVDFGNNVDLHLFCEFANM